MQSFFITEEPVKLFSGSMFLFYQHFEAIYCLYIETAGNAFTSMNPNKNFVKQGANLNLCRASLLAQVINII